MKHLFAVLIIGLAAPFTPQAQDEPRWYEVEVIVFAHQGWVPGDARLYRDPGLPDTRGALNLFLDDGEADRDPMVPLLANASEMPVPDSDKAYPVDLLTGLRIYDQQQFLQLPLERQFQALPPENSQLNGSYRALERSSLYRPLLHVVWRQPVISREAEIPVRLPAGPLQESSGDPDPFNFELLDESLAGQGLHELDGTASLTLSRYIHLEFDLVYRERLFPAPSGYAGTTAAAAARLYRLRERRRVRRPDELHYFDNPRFGVIAQLRRWEFPAPPQSEQTVDEADLIELGTLPAVPGDD